MTLQFKDISVTAGGKVLVNKVNLEVRPTELLGLIGPNGAGKSTLLKAGLGLMPCESGCTFIGERDLGSFSYQERGRQIAYLSQSATVEWEMTSRALVMLGRYPYRKSFSAPSPGCEEAVDRALEAVDAIHLQDQKVQSLSGGEKARVLLARALAVEAPFLVVDEPVAGLDAYHQILVMETLQKEAQKGRGVLVVLHDLALASRFMTQLALLDQGNVVAKGSADEVLTSENLAGVYHVEALSLETEGETYLLPWQRIE